MAAVTQIPNKYLAAVTQRPNKYLAVGGFLKNPIEYTLSSILTFETINVKNSAGTTLFQLRATVRNGFALFDISKPLRSYLKTLITQQVSSYVDSNFLFEFYITGNGFDDTANRRYAVNAKLDVSSSDLSSYVIGTTASTSKRFLTLLKNYFEGLNNFISFIIENETTTKSQIVEIKQLGINENLITTNIIMLPKVKSVYRLLLVLLTACHHADVKIQSCELYYQNPTFAGFTSWFVDTSGDITYSIVDTKLRFTRTGVGGLLTTDAISQTTANVPTNITINRIRMKYRTVGNVTWTLYTEYTSPIILDNGDDMLLDVTFTGTVITAGNPVVPKFNLEAVGGSAGNYIEIEYLLIYDNSLCVDASETIRVKKHNDCNYKKYLTWVNPLGGFESYGFTNFQENKKLISSSDYLAPNARQKTVIEKGSQKTMDLAVASIPKSDLAGIDTLLTSNAVYMIESDGSLTPVVVTSNSIVSQNSKDELYDLSVTIELPFQNS